jgi:hypothetical protein
MSDDIETIPRRERMAKALRGRTRGEAIKAALMLADQLDTAEEIVAAACAVGQGVDRHRQTLFLAITTALRGLETAGQFHVAGGDEALANELRDNALDLLREAVVAGCPPAVWAIKEKLQ